MPSDQCETAQVIWRDRSIPVSLRFDDPYFSLAGGLAEKQHVFLHGNRLAERFRPGFQIAELGFGTGLNLLAACRLFAQTGQGGPVYFTSFEAFPMAAADMHQALAAFPDIAPLADRLVSAWQQGLRRFQIGAVCVEVIEGNASTSLPNWQGRADAWFLDGFSPAKNPDMWRPELLGAVAAHTKPGGTFATYTAAGHVRKALADVGFTVDRVPGFGRKRHMTTGVLKDRK